MVDVHIVVMGTFLVPTDTWLFAKPSKAYVIRGNMVNIYPKLLAQCNLFSVASKHLRHRWRTNITFQHSDVPKMHFAELFQSMHQRTGPPVYMLSCSFVYDLICQHHKCHLSLTQAWLIYCRAGAYMGRAGCFNILPKGRITLMKLVVVFRRRRGLLFQLT